MRIDEFVHSCLRLTIGENRLLFDPGKFSFVDGRVDPAVFSDVSTIVLTHGHPDHIDPDALGRVVQASGATIVGNGEIANKLGVNGLSVTVFEEGERIFGAFRLQAQPVAHEPILSDESPQLTAFLVNDVFVNPDDSFDSRLDRFAGLEVLALPVMAPSLTELTAHAFAKRMQPKAGVPVHDGYARDYFLRQRYDVYEPYLNKAGIQLHRPMAPGDGFDVSPR